MTAIPEIIKETASGFIRTTLQEEMFSKREIQCTGTITQELAESVILQLRYLSSEDSAKAITLFINSPGGETSAGLSVYDVMQAVPNPIRTVCTGTAASMASLIFAAGDQRDILKHSKIMIHDPLISGYPGGSALQVEEMSKNLMQTRSILAEILAAHTGHTAEEILKLTAKDTYFDAEKAVSFGLADNIITHI